MSLTKRQREMLRMTYGAQPYKGPYDSWVTLRGPFKHRKKGFRSRTIKSLIARGYLESDTKDRVRLTEAGLKVGQHEFERGPV